MNDRSRRRYETLKQSLAFVCIVGLGIMLVLPA